MRRESSCINCGEIREIAAHGLCFTCYRREDRAKDRQSVVVDLHNPGIRREHKKIFRGFKSVMDGLSDLSVQRSDVMAIRHMLDPYVAPIAEFLGPAPQNENESAVNGEQKSGDLLTVHRPVAHRAEEAEEKP